MGRGRRQPPKKTTPHPAAKQKQFLTRPRHQAQRGTMVEYMVAFGVARARFLADADLCPSSLCHRFAGSRLRLAQEVRQTPAPSACARRYRSHFGSRYKLGCCGHAGLFCPCCMTQHVLQCYAARAPMSPVGCACSSSFSSSSVEYAPHAHQHIANHSCGVRAHTLSEWRLETPP